MFVDHVDHEITHGFVLEVEVAALVRAGVSVLFVELHSMVFEFGDERLELCDVPAWTIGARERVRAVVIVRQTLRTHLVV